MPAAGGPPARVIAAPKPFYQRRRDAGDGHEAALRRLAGKLLGQLHHCLTHRCRYDPARAWPALDEQQPPWGGDR